MIWGFYVVLQTLSKGSGLFPLFMLFLETEMTMSPPIIIKECIVKNKNLCFESC